MLVAIRIFQIIDLLFMIYYIIHDIRKKDDGWKKLTIAKWVFYFCGIVSFVLSLGLGAEVEALELQNKGPSGVSVIFGLACIISAYIMFFSKMWFIKYNEEVLIFRNSFGVTKRYHIDELTITDGNRENRIWHKGKVVIEWDTMIMNIKEEIAIYKHFNTIKKG